MACPRGAQIIAAVIDGAPDAGGDAESDGAPAFTVEEESTPTSETLHAVWGPEGAGELFVVGDGGVVLRALPDAPWLVVDSGTTANLHAAWGFSAEEVYFGGANATVLRFDGNAFSTVQSIGSETIGGLWGPADGSELIAVTAESGMAIHLFGHGVGLRVEQLGVPLHGVWGSDPSNVFAVGGRGPTAPSIVMRFDGRGWQPMTLPNISRVLRGVWGSGPDHVLAVGEVATALRYDGTAWTLEWAQKADTLLGVWGSGPDDVWVAGGSTLQHFDGSAWSLVPTDTKVGLRGIWGVSPSEVVAVGNQGTILRVRR